MGILPAGINALVLADIDTLAKLAFACSYTPGSPVDTPLRDFLRDVLGSDPSTGQLSCYRRLFFEAHTLSVADLRDKVTRTDESAPRKLPAPERGARYESQKQRLSNLDLTGELEVSHALLDEIVQMAEDDVLHYIPLERCTRRDQEISGVKKDSALKADNKGDIKVVATSVDAIADLASDFMIRSAFQRRSLAFDQSGLISYGVMESWHSELFKIMMRQPPPGYAHVSMGQVVNADRELFRRMAELTRNGIRPTSAGMRPLEDAWKASMRDHTVTHMLQPLQGSSSSAASKIPVAIAKLLPNPPGSGKKAKAKAKRNAALAANNLPYAAPKAKGKGKGKGKALTGDFAGMSSVMPDGSTICFNFNRPSGCSGAQVGQRCNRGMHVCIKCHQTHAFTACPAAGT